MNYNYDDDEIDSLEKNEFSVKIPVTGFIEVTVEAVDKKDAMDRALDLDIDIDEPMMYDHCELETHEIIVTKGGVFYGLLNEIEVDEI